MKTEIKLSIKDDVTYKLYRRLSEGNPISKCVRDWIINRYFDPKVKRNAAIEHNWLQEYFRLLVGFNGICHEINSYEALSAVGFRQGLNRRVLFHMRINHSSDLDVMKQVWEMEEYAPVVASIRRYLSTEDVPLRIIDAGANVGYTTLYLKNAFPNAHIVSLEPEDSNFRQLRRNISINQLANVTAVQAGLWKREAHLQVSNDFRDHREWSFHVEEVDFPSGLKGYSVLDIMQQQNWAEVDLLKIDIEGSERYIFENVDLAREALKSTRLVSIEIHDEFKVRPQIYEFLKQNHFDFFEEGETTIGRNTLLT